MMDVFSESETKLLKLLGRKKLEIAELTDLFYEGEDVFDANNKVAGIIRRINKKCELYKLNWELAGQGTGRAGRTVWKEKRQQKKK